LTPRSILREPEILVELHRSDDSGSLDNFGQDATGGKGRMDELGDETRP
jgi:hypothetical protein